MSLHLDQDQQGLLILSQPTRSFDHPGGKSLANPIFSLRRPARHLAKCPEQKEPLFAIQSCDAQNSVAWSGGLKGCKQHLSRVVLIYFSPLGAILSFDLLIELRIRLSWGFPIHLEKSPGLSHPTLVGSVKLQLLYVSLCLLTSKSRPEARDGRSLSDSWHDALGRFPKPSVRR